MMDWIGGERRNHERASTEQRFRCFLGGRRFTATLHEISAGGAFVEIDRIIRPGGTLILEQLRPGMERRAPALVARIVHFKLKPFTGIGVQWLKAVSENGLQDLRAFIREEFGLEVAEVELKRLRGVQDQDATVSYDFKTGVLGLEKARESHGDKIVSMFGIKVSERTMDKLGLGDVRVVQSEAPKKKRAILRTDPDESEAKEDSLRAAKRLDEWSRLKRLGRPVEVPVTLAFDGKSVNGRSASLSTKTLFVQCPERLPPGGSRILVRFPVKTAQSLIAVIIVGEVQKSLRSPDGAEWGASLKIANVNEGESPGVFRRYVETL